MEHCPQSEQGRDALDSGLLMAVERWVLFAALALTAVAALSWRTPEATGSAAVGGLLAVLNLTVLRRTVAGFLGSSVGKQAALSIVLVLKMGLLLAAVWVAVRVLGFDALGVALGMSAVLVGIVGGTLAFGQQAQNTRAQPER